MIDIKVNGQKLYIPADTSLVLEQNNNSFDIDNIASDIIWTFDIPAKPNAVALGSAHYISVSNYKRYQCEILFNGVVIANGSLYIQSVSNEKTVSCGVVLDGLGDGFGGKKLKENDYGADVVISQTSDSLEQHRANWISFLRGSLSENSIYKFFLFTCEKFYKDNEDYGYHQNKRATLRTDHNEKFWCNYINRLFEGRDILGNYGVGNFADSSEWGIKLFNTLGANTEKLNGFAFAPALRLDWLTRKVFENAGFSIIGDFLTNENIKKLYIQSMNAMDGDLRAFGLDEYFYVTGGGTGTDGVSTENSMDIGFNEVSYEGFKLGANAPTFNFRFYADVDGLTRGTSLTPTNAYPWTVEDEVFMLLIRSTDMVAANKYPKVRAVKDSSATTRDYVYGLHTFGPGAITKFVMYDNNTVGYWNVNGVWLTGNTVTTNDSDGLYCIQLTPSTGDNCNYNDPQEEADIVGNFTATQLLAQGNTSKNYVVELAKFKIKSVQHGTWNGDASSITAKMVLPNGDTTANRYQCNVFIQKYGQLEGLEYISTIEKTKLANTNTLLNVFDTMLRWKQHVPNISNADYIKKICKFFGLSIYTNPFQKEVQLSFVNNVFEAGAIDLSDYVTDTERLTYEPKQFKVGVDTVLGKKGVAEDFMLEDTDCHNNLPPARSMKKCSIFVKNENAYRHSVQDSKTNKYKWELSAGNDKTMEVGNDGDDLEELTTEIDVPNMRVVDTDGTKIYVCDIATGGNSKLMDDDYTGEFEMILQQYKGRRMFHHIQGISYYFEDANPTSMVTNGNVNDDYLDLATVGKNSVGERWLRKFYEFKAHQEKFRFVARLPLSMFMAVYNLQQPQHVAVCDEKRWIMVKNRKYLPTKITYEFGKGDFVLTTIECSRQHYD